MDDAAISKSTTAQAFILALFEELESRKITPEVWTEDGNPPPPALLLFVDRYDDGEPVKGFASAWFTAGRASERASERR